MEVFMGGCVTVSILIRAFVVLFVSGEAFGQAAQCLIKTANCPSASYSYLSARLAAGTYDDGYNGARTNAQKCLARAEAFYQVCEGHQPVTATYVVGGKVNSSKTYNGFLTGAI